MYTGIKLYFLRMFFLNWMNVIDWNIRAFVIIILCLQWDYHINGNMLSQASRGTEINQGMFFDFFWNSLLWKLCIKIPVNFIRIIFFTGFSKKFYLFFNIAVVFETFYQKHLWQLLKQNIQFHLQLILSIWCCLSATNTSISFSQYITQRSGQRSSVD